MASVAGDQAAAVTVRVVAVGSRVAVYPVPATLRAASIWVSVEGVVIVRYSRFHRSHTEGPRGHSICIWRRALAIPSWLGCPYPQSP